MSPQAEQRIVRMDYHEIYFYTSSIREWTMQKHWNLIDDPIKYPFSSARYYETGVNDFDFLFDYRNYTGL